MIDFYFFAKLVVLAIISRVIYLHGYNHGFKDGKGGPMTGGPKNPPKGLFH